MLAIDDVLDDEELERVSFDISAEEDVEERVMVSRIEKGVLGAVVIC